jgi:hypothetical protein
MPTWYARTTQTRGWPSHHEMPRGPVRRSGTEGDAAAGDAAAGDAAAGDAAAGDAAAGDAAARGGSPAGGDAGPDRGGGACGSPIVGAGSATCVGHTLAHTLVHPADLCGEGGEWRVVRGGQRTHDDVDGRDSGAVCVSLRSRAGVSRVDIVSVHGRPERWERRIPLGRACVWRAWHARPDTRHVSAFRTVAPPRDPAPA